MQSGVTDELSVPRGGAAGPRFRDTSAGGVQPARGAGAAVGVMECGFGFRSGCGNGGGCRKQRRSNTEAAGYGSSTDVG